MIATKPSSSRPAGSGGGALGSSSRRRSAAESTRPDPGCNRRVILSWAGFLADRFRAVLAVCHVLSPALLGRAQMVSGIAASRQMELRCREQGEAWLRSRLTGHAGPLEHAELLVSVGSAGFQILAAQARLGIDLTVMGSRGESALARGMLGSVASKVLRGAACPALVVRRGGSSFRIDARRVHPAAAGVSEPPCVRRSGSCRPGLQPARNDAGLTTLFRTGGAACGCLAVAVECREAWWEHWSLWS